MKKPQIEGKIGYWMTKDWYKMLMFLNENEDKYEYIGFVGFSSGSFKSTNYEVFLKLKIT
ncbi:MAG: hypothetical protein ACTSRI_05705 [Promethearchaeota archaeon]